VQSRVLGRLQSPHNPGCVKPPTRKRLSNKHEIYGARPRLSTSFRSQHWVMAMKDGAGHVTDSQPQCWIFGGHLGMTSLRTLSGDRGQTSVPPRNPCSSSLHGLAHPSSLTVSDRQRRKTSPPPPHARCKAGDKKRAVMALQGRSPNPGFERHLVIDVFGGTYVEGTQVHLRQFRAPQSHHQRTPID
jgi:hypothetical protein